MQSNPKQRRNHNAWQQLIDQQAHSGLSIKAFCEQQELNANSFSAWKTKLKVKNAGFVKAKLNSRSPDNQLRCTLPNGIELEWREAPSVPAMLAIIKGLS